MCCMRICWTGGWRHEDRDIDLDKDVLVVAEIGNNHEGNFETAAQLIAAAAGTGAQAVKFQTFIPEYYVSRDQSERLDRLHKFSLSFAQFAELAELARKRGPIFLSTPFDLESAEALCGFCPAIKISSGDNVFFPLLEKVAASKLPVVLSTGLATLSDVEAAKSALSVSGPLLDIAVSSHCFIACQAIRRLRRKPTWQRY